MQRTYAFTLTDGKGLQHHGICRQVLLPPASPAADSHAPTHTPTILCILTPHPYFYLFHRALEVLHHLLDRDGFLPPNAPPPDLPHASDAATFVTSLHLSLAQFVGAPTPGSVLRITLPRSAYDLTPIRLIQTSVPAGAPTPETLAALRRPLVWGADFAEVQVPPQVCAGSSAPTVPLACLVYHLSPPIIATLLASLFMERRIILTAASFGKVSAAVHAAAALLHPFRWHNIFLPLLPSSLLDLLSSPTPYLVGLPAALRGAVTWAAIDSCVIVDLDADAIEPAVGGAGSDSAQLPGWDALVAAFSAMQDALRGPAEYHANATVSAIVQEWLAVIIGRYREFIRSPAQTPPRPQSSATQRLQGGVQRLKKLGANVSRSRSGHSDRSSSLGGLEELPPSLSASSDTLHSMAREEDVIEGDNGFRFFHSAFAASFSRRQEREFAAVLLQTQLWQVFVRERIVLIQQPYVTADEFELRILRRRRNDSVRAAWGSMMSMGKQAAGAVQSSMKSVLAKIEGTSDAGDMQGGSILAGSAQPHAFFDDISRATPDTSPTPRQHSLAGGPGRAGGPGHRRAVSTSHAQHPGGWRDVDSLIDPVQGMWPSQAQAGPSLSDPHLGTEAAAACHAPALVRSGSLLKSSANSVDVASLTASTSHEHLPIREAPREAQGNVENQAAVAAQPTSIGTSDNLLQLDDAHGEPDHSKGLPDSATRDSGKAAMGGADLIQFDDDDGGPAPDEPVADDPFANFAT